MSKTEEILKERGARYGSFKDRAVICQDLKGIMAMTPSWEDCTPSQRQALEVIADKIARILNGDPSYDDNWQDIIGYSQLVLNEIREHDGQGSLFDGLDNDKEQTIGKPELCIDKHTDQER